jgi:hypothetical protein
MFCVQKVLLFGCSVYNMVSRGDGPVYSFARRLHVFRKNRFSSNAHRLIVENLY